MKKKSRQRSETTKKIVKSKFKRLTAIVIIFVISLLIWIILYTNNGANTSFHIPLINEIIAAIAIAMFVLMITMCIEIRLYLDADDGFYRDIVSNFLKKQCHFCKTSLEYVFKTRKAANMIEKLKTCNQNVKFLVTNLETVVYDSEFFNELKKCIDRGVKIEICTIDPSIAYTFNIHRVTGGDNDPDTRFLKMKNSLKTLIQYRDDNTIPPDKLDIRTYVTFPTMILFIFDHDCFLSLMFHNTFARNAIHFQFNIEKDNLLTSFGEGAIYADSFKKHFEGVFTDSKQISLQDVEKMVFCK